MSETPPETSEEGKALAERLASAKGLHALLGDAEVKAAILAELRDHGVPAPALVYRAIVFAAGRSERFLGGAIASRLQAFIDRSPVLSGLIQKVINLEHGARGKDQLKASLITAIREGKPPDHNIAADEATSLDMVMALYNTEKLENITAKFGTLERELLTGFRRDIAALTDQMFRPPLSWPETSDSAETLSAFDRLKYTSGLDKFLGREAELELLERFTGDASFGGRLFNFRWLLMTGDGGLGKTRLAHYFTKEKLGPQWDAGKLDLDTLRKFPAPEKWLPLRPTFIVIDYAKTAPEEIGRLMRAFAREAKHYEFPVRLLLLERDADASWTDRMLPNDGDLPALMDHGFGEAPKEGVALAPLWPEQIIELMKGRFWGGLKPPKDEELFSFACQVDPPEVNGATRRNPVPRPLFALAAADAVIDAMREGGGPPEQLNQEEVLAGIITRDRQTIWRKAVPDDPKRRRYERGLALATFVQGLSLSDLTETRFGKAMRWLPPPPPDEDQRALGAFGYRNGVWEPLEPDILGEYFLSEILLDPGMPAEIRQAFILGALEVNSPEPAIMLLRLARDFPARFERFDLAGVVHECANVEVARDIAGMTIDLSARDGAESRATTDLVAVLPDLTHRFGDEVVALREAMVAFNISIDAGEAGDWRRVDEMLKRIDALRSSFPDDREIALREAMVAVNISSHAGEAGDWRRVDAMLKRIDALRSSFPDDREIALRETMVAVNISSHAGEAGDWRRIDAMLERIDALRISFPDDREIALREAMVAVNISSDAGEAGDWRRVDAMLKRVDALRSSFPDDREIALQEAMVAVNISSDAGEAGDWQRVDAMLERIDALRISFPDDREIALRETMVAVNISSHAGEAGDRRRVTDMLRRLDLLIDAFGAETIIGEQGGEEVTLAMERSYIATILEGTTDS